MLLLDRKKRLVRFQEFETSMQADTMLIHYSRAALGSLHQPPPIRPLKSYGDTTAGDVDS